MPTDAQPNPDQIPHYATACLFGYHYACPGTCADGAPCACCADHHELQVRPAAIIRIDR